MNDITYYREIFKLQLLFMNSVGSMVGNRKHLHFVDYSIPINKYVISIYLIVKK